VDVDVDVDGSSSRGNASNFPTNAEESHTLSHRWLYNKPNVVNPRANFVLKRHNVQFSNFEGRDGLDACA
jgi:hypothetical protein